MNIKVKREIIATLLKAKRPDLANTASHLTVAMDEAVLLDLIKKTEQEIKDLRETGPSRMSKQGVKWSLEVNRKRLRDLKQQLVEIKKKAKSPATDDETEQYMQRIDFLKALAHRLEPNYGAGHLDEEHERLSFSKLGRRIDITLDDDPFHLHNILTIESHSGSQRSKNSLRIPGTPELTAKKLIQILGYTVAATKPEDTVRKIVEDAAHQLKGKFKVLHSFDDPHLRGPGGGYDDLDMDFYFTIAFRYTDGSDRVCAVSFAHGMPSVGIGLYDTKVPEAAGRANNMDRDSEEIHKLKSKTIVDFCLEEE